MPAIIVDHIIKKYKADKQFITALDDVSFETAGGELFGLIGPDGAGKTSLIRILTTLLLADAGTASVDGFDVVKNYKTIRNRVGYMPGKFSLYHDLSVEENLEFFATIFNTTIGQNYDLIKDIYVQIEPFKKRKAGELSGGMKQKLALCCALIHRPSVLFLDEPTTGVDAVSRKEFWEMLQQLKRQGITMLVSTPYMDEAAQCDKVALIQKGKVLGIDTPKGITGNFKKPLLAIKATNMYGLLHGIRTSGFAESCYPFGEFHHLVPINNISEEEIRNYLAGKGHEAVEINRTIPDIEDCFLELMTKVNT
jgi:ABC-type multidrug transport system ATPase subunit